MEESQESDAQRDTRDRTGGLHGGKEVGGHRLDLFFLRHGGRGRRVGIVVRWSPVSDGVHE